MLDNIASDVYVEWLATEDAKKNNYTLYGDWTPVYWKMRREDNRFDLTKLTVLGRILGYCKMGRNQCDASKHTIAKETGMSLATVKRTFQWLEGNDYIRDLTPNRTKAPHAYIPSPKTENILSGEI